MPNVPPHCSIAPWLTVHDGPAAIRFYQAAFDATETYHLDDPSGGVVARLSIAGAEFWISGEPTPEHPPAANEKPPIRMILTVPDPDAVFDRAVAAGATVVFPVSEGHGWRVGRVVDPFGHHWEIGRPLARAQP